MPVDDDYLTDEDLRHVPRCGDDTPSISANIPDPPPSHWGTMTSSPRTASPQYLDFLRRNTEQRQCQKS
jgi:hypothetical protein